jgi:hypothetical protein
MPVFSPRRSIRQARFRRHHARCRLSPAIYRIIGPRLIVAGRPMRPVRVFERQRRALAPFIPQGAA